jgi:Outer membrane protein beta-barrel domain
MKRFIRTIQTLALALAAFHVLPASAEQPRGFYMGVGVGDAEADVSAGDMDQLFRDAFRAQGGSYAPQTSSIETKNSHLYVFAGYRIFPWLSAEGGYVNLGGFDYVSRGTVSSPGGGTQQINLRMEVESQGIAVNALGNLPLSDYFEIHARLGFFGVETEATARGGSVTRPVNESDSGISFSAQFGVGAAVNLGNHFSLSADWVHYFDIDNSDSSDDEDSYDYDGFDVDALRLSAIVRF